MLSANSDKDIMKTLLNQGWVLKWGEKEYGLDKVGDNLSGTVKECLEVKKIFGQLEKL